jgi:hypothetical protein
VLEDDAETVLKMEHLPDKKSRLSVRKQKEEDAVDIPDMVFRREPVQLDTTNNMGVLETSYVLVPDSYIPPIVQQARSNEEILLDILEADVQLNNTQLQAECQKHRIGQRKYEEIRDRLVELGRIECREGEHNAHIYTLSDLEATQRASKAGLFDQEEDELFLQEDEREELASILGLHEN